MTNNLHYLSSLAAGESNLPLSSNIRPSGTGHGPAETNDSSDEILSYLSKLFDGLDLDSEVENTSSKDETTSELPENTLVNLPKCKAYDIPLELASAAYFIVDHFIYAWNNIDWSIFSVNEACEPSDPFYVAAPNQDIVIMDAVFRIDENGTIFRWFGFDQWAEEPLYDVYGDVYALLQESIRMQNSFPLPLEESSFLPTYVTGTESSYSFGESLPVHITIPEDRATTCQIQSKQLGVDHSDKGKNTKDSESSDNALLNSLLGFGPNLIEPSSPVMDEVFPLIDANGVDLSTPFLGEGISPDFASITQWVELQKGMRRTPGSTWFCPLNGCEQVLRRPHALKDHLLFHFDIKAFKCPYLGCTSSFATKCNCDRHKKNCKYVPKGTMAS
ncbi:unnamed protein product [Rhizoctonia solani]|uniref:C2H2-type domain-containing protein n=1 Tax=Rhizoctonia solani TaxID=456999 RepID=A0A8H2WVM0_9AGAM|nr:unnamed protein product [Rhizoctonia solani]